MREGLYPAYQLPAVEVSADETVDLSPDQDVTLSIATNNFILNTSAMGQENGDGTGHYHVYWNDNVDLDFLTASGDETVVVTIPEDAPAGDHSLRVELRNNDHSALDPVAEFVLPMTITL